jgi:hypothetical protein
LNIPVDLTSGIIQHASSTHLPKCCARTCAAAPRASQVACAIDPIDIGWKRPASGCRGVRKVRKGSKQISAKVYVGVLNQYDADYSSSALLVCAQTTWCMMATAADMLGAAAQQTRMAPSVQLPIKLLQTLPVQVLLGGPLGPGLYPMLHVASHRSFNLAPSQKMRGHLYVVFDGKPSVNGASRHPANRQGQAALRNLWPPFKGDGPALRHAHAYLLADVMAASTCGPAKDPAWACFEDLPSRQAKGSSFLQNQHTTSV